MFVSAASCPRCQFLGGGGEKLTIHCVGSSGVGFLFCVARPVKKCAERVVLVRLDRRRHEARRHRARRLSRRVRNISDDDRCVFRSQLRILDSRAVSFSSLVRARSSLVGQRRDARNRRQPRARTELRRRLALAAHLRRGRKIRIDGERASHRTRARARPSFSDSFDVVSETRPSFLCKSVGAARSFAFFLFVDREVDVSAAIRVARDSDRCVDRWRFDSMLTDVRSVCVAAVRDSIAEIIA